MGVLGCFVWEEWLFICVVVYLWRWLVVELRVFGGRFGMLYLGRMGCLFVELWSCGVEGVWQIFWTT